MQTKTVGIGLIIIGIVLTLYNSFNYITTEKVVDVGPIQINKEKNHPVQWSPFIGGAILIGGVIILIASPKNKRI